MSVLCESACVNMYEYAVCVHMHECAVCESACVHMYECALCMYECIYMRVRVCEHQGATLAGVKGL